MDDELRAALNAMQAETIAAVRSEVTAMRNEVAAMRSEVTAMRRDINDSQERLLNRLNALSLDFQNTKAFLLNDSATAGRRWLDLEDRVTRLERRDQPNP